MSTAIWNRAIWAAKAAKEKLSPSDHEARYGAQYVIVALVEARDAEVEDNTQVNNDLGNYRGKNQDQDQGK